MHRLQGLRSTYGGVSDISSSRSTIDCTDFGVTEKYLPALRCLLAVQSSDSARAKELSSRLKVALDKSEDSLPKEAQQAMEALFISKQ